jgi:hypothetical protein
MLPDQSGFQKTIEGRAKRLRKRLIAVMPEIGWRVSNNRGVTSACNAATLRSRSGMPLSGALGSRYLVRDFGLRAIGRGYFVVLKPEYGPHHDEAQQLEEVARHGRAQ